MKKDKVKYISDCCGAFVRQIDDEHGLCTRCDQICWACDPEMLKPISMERIKNSVPKSKMVQEK